MQRKESVYESVNGKGECINRSMECVYERESESIEEMNVIEKQGVCINRNRESI